MNELNEFLNVIASARKEKKEHIQETKADMDDFFKMVATVKAQDPKQQLIKKIKENVKGDISSLFEQLSNAKQVSVEKVDQLVEAVQQIEQVEEPQQETITEVVESIEKTDIQKLADALPKESFQQPEVPKVAPEFKVITDKLKFLEQWVSKISAAGPGSGEVNLRWLDDVDRPTIYDMRYLRYNDTKKKFEFAEVNPHDIVYTTHLVETSTYTINDDDYYVGVNYNGPTTITLPTPSSGRMVIIKDESGNAETNPITVQGVVDNDPGGFIIQINNGAIQLIYRNGWRIV